MRRKIMLSLTLSAAALAGAAQAQNLGGVFSPVVKEGHRSLQYRSGYVLPEDGGPWSLGQRIHYQHALNDRLMARVVGQTRWREDDDFQFVAVRGEMFWQFTDDADRFQVGSRFDLIVRDEGRPNTIGANLMTQYAFTPRLSGRALVMSSVDTGSNANDGVTLQTRARLQYSFDRGPAVLVDVYNNYGSTTDDLEFDQQNHQVGPFVSADVPRNWSALGGVLFGVSEAAADTELRLWLTRKL